MSYSEISTVTYLLQWNTTVACYNEIPVMIIVRYQIHVTVRYQLQITISKYQSRVIARYQLHVKPRTHISNECRTNIRQQIWCVCQMGFLKIVWHRHMANASQQIVTVIGPEQTSFNVHSIYQHLREFYQMRMKTFGHHSFAFAVPSTYPIHLIYVYGALYWNTCYIL